MKDNRDITIKVISNKMNIDKLVKFFAVKYSENIKV